MARYVMLSFDHNDEAEAFIKAVQRKDGVIYSKPLEGAEFQYMPLPENVFVRGVWAKPTSFCPGLSCTGNKGFTRGQKFGWWVCATCKKPRKGWADGDPWYVALGNNLLPVSEQAPEFRLGMPGKPPTVADMSYGLWNTRNAPKA